MTKVSEIRRYFSAELPTEVPKISGVKDKYVSGDILRANCTAGRSHPAATIKWSINKKEVPRKNTFTYPPVRHPDGLETTITELRLQLRDHHFSRGLINLRCTATVEALYTRTDQDFLQVEDSTQKPLVLERKDSQISVNSSPTSGAPPSLLLLLLLVAALAALHH
ncbi:uncharacterized protein LOC122258889 [Penaeus japonicus]|uniref:uncharacterized protein LOC122258889 n=1 Tax=Penaeus japonicus TaxID=27405 RepID=UPI001C717A22|nr:uncharacterized protein LOC122258889 [Penaeus japonicus]